MFAERGMGLETWLNVTWLRPGWQSMGTSALERGIDAATIAPTERDEVFRQRVVRGTVHDPGAAMQGGVGGHAGLFSNAYDLRRARRVVAVEAAARRRARRERRADCMDGTRLPESDNRRGMVFDKPVLDPDSGPTCDLASWES